MKWLKYKYIYFSLSLILIIIGIYSLFAWKLKLGVDFTGGSIVEYQINTDTTVDEVSFSLDGLLGVSSVQKTLNNSYLIKLPEDTNKDSVSVLLNEQFDNVVELRFEKVGPTVGKELVKKTLYAIVVAASIILLWVAYQFKSLKYGISAILAMFHDSFILVGSFSLLGHFGGAEIDFLFVTALLTTLSFSVHDTIVVFDRIRENEKTGEDLETLANQAISETMVRSLNNSFTIIFMLVALVLMGGTTVRWFSVALLIGTILGTYSSPFVAVPLLVTLDQLKKDK